MDNLNNIKKDVFELTNVLLKKMPFIYYSVLVDYISIFYQGKYPVSRIKQTLFSFANIKSIEITKEKPEIVSLCNKLGQTPSNSFKDEMDCLRVIMTFLPDSNNFCRSNSPFNFMFTSEGKIVQVSKLNQGSEFLLSTLMCEQGVNERDRQFYRRIVILENRNNADLIKKAGVSDICCITDDKIEILKKILPEKMWDDVRE